MAAKGEGEEEGGGSERGPSGVQGAVSPKP